MLSRRNFLVAAAASVALPVMAATDQGLKLAFIPQENPEKLLGDINIITGWLSEQMGVPVTGFVTFDHAAAVEALRNGDADISFMGALPFVLAEDQIGAVPLLSEVYRGQPSYSGRVFVRRDSGIETLADLRGRDIAFSDPVSNPVTSIRLICLCAPGCSRAQAMLTVFSGRSSLPVVISKRCRPWPTDWSMRQAQASMPISI